MRNLSSCFARAGRLPWPALVLCAALVAGCGDDGGGDPDSGPPADAGGDGGGDADAGPVDEEPPELRDVVAMLGEPSPGTLDLSSGDVERVIVQPTPLTVRIFAMDDTSATEDLVVELVDPDTLEPLAEQSAELASGLWRVQTTAEPGLAVTARVTDEAGNEAVWPNAARFPSRAEALEREWTLIRYDGSGTVVERRTSTWADGTWCTEGGAEASPAGGSFSVDAGLLTVEERHRMACDVTDYGAEWDTVEHSRTAEFYVDATYLSLGPLEREGTGSGAVGTWTRMATVDDGSGAAEVTERLVLAEDGSLRWELADGTVREGTYELRENGGYEENFGDLLIETVDTVDGSPVTAETRVRFYALRDGTLLVDPYVDVR